MRANLAEVGKFLGKTQTQKKKVYKIWKQVEVTQKRYRGTVFKSAQLGKPKPIWNWKCKWCEDQWQKFLSSEGKMRENLSLMLKEAEDLMLQDMGNAKILNALFALAFMDSICLQESQTPEISGKSEARN